MSPDRVYDLEPMLHEYAPRLRRGIEETGSKYLTGWCHGDHETDICMSIAGFVDH